MKPSVRAKLLHDLDVSLSTVKILLADGNGNGVVIMNHETKELFVSGYFRDRDEFYVLPLHSLKLVKGISMTDLKEGSRVEIQPHDDIKRLFH